MCLSAVYGFAPPAVRILQHQHAPMLVSDATYSSSTKLFHMGHSHSHHHHHDHNENSEVIELDPALRIQRQRRRIALVAFCGAATFGPSLLVKRSITRWDWVAFGVTTVVLSSADKVRLSLKQSINKLIRIKDGIVKHTPQHNEGVGTTVTSVQLQADAKEADRVTWIGVVINLLLSVGKLFVGITAHSSALIADAGHSLSDLVSDFITLWAVQVARLPADEDHPYGHWKFEAIGSLFLSLTLIATAFSVGSMAKKQLSHILANAGNLAVKTVVPGPLALVMASISIASKEWLYRITRRVGEKIRSQVVIANAWHHRSDAYSSVLALASIAWARSGFLAADAAAGLLVAGMIGMTGGEILLESVQQLSDGSNPSLLKECSKLCAKFLGRDDDVEMIKSIKARQVGSLSLVEVQLTCSTHLSTTAARAVEEKWKYWLKEHGYEATVHAKPKVILCPLLLNNGPSAGLLESMAREQAMLSGNKVERVTVHYEDCQTNIDVILSQENDDEMPLPDLVYKGQQLKETLQEMDLIDRADIYWDLSRTPEPVVPVVSS